VVLLSNFAVTFLAMSVESLMAYGTPEDAKGRSAGWFQAGNLGGFGLGGGAGLWIAQHFQPSWMAGAVLAVASLSCCAAIAFVAEPQRAPREDKYYRTLATVIRICGMSPDRAGGFSVPDPSAIGTGAASNLWSASPATGMRAQKRSRWSPAC
jgi:MFS family permease